MHGWTPNLGSIWEHYKGRKYQVLGFSTEESTGTACVLYRSVESNKTWHRPLSEWQDVVMNDENQPVLRYTNCG